MRNLGYFFAVMLQSVGAIGQPNQQQVVGRLLYEQKLWVLSQSPQHAAFYNNYQHQYSSATFVIHASPKKFYKEQPESWVVKFNTQKFEKQVLSSATAMENLKGKVFLPPNFPRLNSRNKEER